MATTLLRTAMFDYVKAMVHTGQITPETATTNMAVLAPLMQLVGNRHLNKIDRVTIEKGVADLVAAEYDPATINRAINLVNGMFKRAVDIGLVEKNPAANVFKPKGKKHKIVLNFSKADVDQFLEGSYRHKRGIVARLIAGTGMRRSELIALLWSDFDGEKLSITKSRSPHRVKEPKSDAGRRSIFLPPKLRDELTALKEVSPPGYIIQGPSGGALNYYEIGRFFKEMSAISGVSMTAHKLRHYHASQLLSEGKPLPAVARRLGHASPTITLGFYAHAFEHEDRELVGA